MAMDSVIAEMRQAREALAQRFNYDLRAMIQDARERQEAGGRKVVSFPPRPVGKTTVAQVPLQRVQSTGMTGES